MKILLILFLTTFGFSAIAGQNDWKKTEHNYNLKYKEYGVNLRQYYRDDYKHAEFKYKKKGGGGGGGVKGRL